MAQIVSCREDEWKDNLERLGFFLGKFIYLLDAYEDVDGEDVLNDEYLSPLDALMPAQAYVDVEYIFAFGTDKFKSFSRETDSSD